MRQSPHRLRVPRAGFTLLEVVLAMTLLVMLMGMVFSTSKSSLGLAHRVVETQNEEMARMAFFDLLGRRFNSLPGNAIVDLHFSQGAGSQVLSDLTMQNVPFAFSWSGTDKVAKAVRISTVKRGDGYLDIVLRYYENEILDDGSGNDSQGNPIEKNPKPFAEVVMLEQIAFFEWRVLDGRTMEYQYDWDQRGRLPLQFELKAAFGAHGEEIRHVFWITPKQNPEVVMRQLQSGAGGSNPGSGGGGGDINVGDGSFNGGGGNPPQPPTQPEGP